MNTDIIATTARATLDGAICFPAVVGKLPSAGVDFLDIQKTGQEYRVFKHRAMQSGVLLIAPGMFTMAMVRTWGFESWICGIAGTYSLVISLRALFENAAVAQR